MAMSQAQHHNTVENKAAGFFARLWNDIKLLADLITGTLKGIVDKLLGAGERSCLAH